MQAIADAFGINVGGFDKEVKWCRYIGGKIDRGRIVLEAEAPGPDVLCSDPTWHNGADELTRPIGAKPHAPKQVSPPCST